MRKTVLALLLAVSVTPAFAQEKNFELKLSHWVPASHPLQKALEDWGAAVEKASGGTLTYKVYPAQQLGKAFDHYDMARHRRHRGRRHARRHACRAATSANRCCWRRAPPLRSSPC